MCYYGEARVRQISRSSITVGKNGFRYKVEISIEEHWDLERYPEGVKAVFKLIRLDINDDFESELVVLIDNHHPYGFHSHDKLPREHGHRVRLCLSDWRQAWEVFQEKCQEILK